MKKISIHFLQLLAIVGATALASCKKDDTVNPVNSPTTLTAKADPTAGYIMPTGATTLRFEKGEKVKIKVNASVPSGVQIFNIKKKVGSAAETDVTASFTGLPAPGATSYEKVFEVTVAETHNATTAAENKVTYTFNVKSPQATVFTTSTFSYDVATQGQGGGGGIAPLLRALVSVALGSQTATEGSYLTSATGVVTNVAATTALTAAQKQAVDITFGVGDATGAAQLGASATHNILISPDERSTKGFNGVPLGTDARPTSFKIATTITSLTNLTSTDVNSIDHSAATTKFVTFDNASTPVFSFKNNRGAKGYVRIVSVTGTGDQRVANIEVLVQQIL